ncbi:protein of unknown function [Cupriavidus taiwanensis]|uniref:Uncharacterized protein n=1 Tax=Cupriavidus taiwanensis TaxID=164546 RepID=A0A9Q7USK0_9BURK|nr:protein of unknown function [Cupriavidus taiwanensis]
MQRYGGYQGKMRTGCYRLGLSLQPVTLHVLPWLLQPFCGLGDCVKRSSPHWCARWQMVTYGWFRMLELAAAWALLESR